MEPFDRIYAFQLPVHEWMTVLRDDERLNFIILMYLRQQKRLNSYQHAAALINNKEIAKFEVKYQEYIFFITSVDEAMLKFEKENAGAEPFHEFNKKYTSAFNRVRLVFPEVMQDKSLTETIDKHFFEAYEHALRREYIECLQAYHRFKLEYIKMIDNLRTKMFE